ncbi:MAG: sugar phosphate nucleotidyltransferase [Chromatiaceae bacterium]
MSLDTLTLVIATGQGEGLSPLTLHRTKAAVPFGGKFRLIDFTLANCLHSGLRKILVLTQYKSHSLQKHLRDGWSIFHPELGEFITPVPPQMRDGGDWYAGAFDAMRQNRYLIERNKARYVLVLDGTLVYRMDYAELVRYHRERSAGVTLGCRAVERSLADHARGLSLDSDDRLADGTSAQQSVSEDDRRQVCAPMGVYLFDKDLLLSALEGDETVLAAEGDSIADALPEIAGVRGVFAYRFGGERGRVTPDRYWCDVADIDSYYAANMALLETDSPLDLYQEDWNILTYQGQYPPARTVPGRSGTEGIFVNSMLAAGTVITGGGVNHSILYPQVRVGDGAIVEDAILFNGVSVGEGAHIRRCIIDKDVTVPPRERIGFDLEADRRQFAVSQNLVVVISKAYRF